METSQGNCIAREKWLQRNRNYALDRLGQDVYHAEGTPHGCQDLADGEVQILSHHGVIAGHGGYGSCRTTTVPTTAADHKWRRKEDVPARLLEANSAERIRRTGQRGRQRIS